MKMTRKLAPGFTLVELLVVIVIIAALAGLTAPMVIRQRKKADMTEAINNAKQMGLALLEFDSEYNSFPDASTAATVNTNLSPAVPAPTTVSSSNDAFKQLMVAEIAKSETMFNCKTAYTVKADNVMSTATEMLKKGEVGFGYVMNQTTALGTSSNPGCVVAIAPLDASGGSVSSNTFDIDAYDSKAVALKIDSSVASLNIIKSTKVAQLNGKAFFTATTDTVWGGSITPTIAIPLKK